MNRRRARTRDDVERTPERARTNTSPMGRKMGAVQVQRITMARRSAVRDRSLLRGKITRLEALNRKDIVKIRGPTGLDRNRHAVLYKHR